jgi:hypothetical protein
MATSAEQSQALIEADVASTHAPFNSLYVLFVSSIVGRHLISSSCLPLPPPIPSDALSKQKSLV